MVKNMARIKDGVVVNVEWCCDDTAETESLKEMNDLPVVIGDTWKDGMFYRGVDEILPILAAMTKEIDEYGQSLMVLGVEL